LKRKTGRSKFGRARDNVIPRGTHFALRIHGVGNDDDLTLGGAMRTRWTARILIGCLGLGVAGAGCETVQKNPRSTGTVIGGAAGAGIGSAVAGKGKRTEGALIGAGVGAVGGWIAGNAADNDHKSSRKSTRRYRNTYDDDYPYRARPARYRDSYDRYDRYDRYDDRYYDRDFD
jgi:hypothetical protein